MLLSWASEPYVGAWRWVVALAGVGLLLARAVRDLRRAPPDPRRAKEYAFLLATTLAAVAYGSALDQGTVTLSPGYFLEGKDLASDPRPLRVAVAWLAVEASWWPGLVLGAVLLLANNPGAPGRPPPLGYPALARAALVPLAGAALGGALGAGLCGARPAPLFGWLGANPLGMVEAARDLVPPRQVRAFLVVWGIHGGTYAGALAGGLAAAGLVRAQRRRAASRSGSGSRPDGSRADGLERPGDQARAPGSAGAPGSSSSGANGGS